MRAKRELRKSNVAQASWSSLAYNLEFCAAEFSWGTIPLCGLTSPHHTTPHHRNYLTDISKGDRVASLSSDLLRLHPQMVCCLAKLEGSHC